MSDYFKRFSRPEPDPPQIHEVVVDGSPPDDMELTVRPAAVASYNEREVRISMI